LRKWFGRIVRLALGRPKALQSTRSVPDLFLGWRGHGPGLRFKVWPTSANGFAPRVNDSFPHLPRKESYDTLHESF